MPYSSSDKQRANLAKRRESAKTFFQGIKDATFCAHCGAQPVEFHCEAHIGRHQDRVSCLVWRGAGIPRIQEELDRCEALCRRCHMIEDGRLERFVTAGADRMRGKTTPPRPCADCQRLYRPLRRERCNWCYKKFMGQVHPKFSIKNRQYANKYKGVRRNRGKYQAYVLTTEKTFTVGRHDTPEEAARAHDRKAVELFGDSAITNAKLGLL